MAKAAQTSIVLFLILSLGLSSVFRHFLRDHINIIATLMVFFEMASIFCLAKLTHVDFFTKKRFSLLFLGIFLFTITSTLSSLTQTESIRSTLAWAIFLNPYSLFLFLWALPKVFTLNHYENIFKFMIGFVSTASFICLVIYALEIREIGTMKLPFIGFTEENFYRYCLFVNRNYSAQFVLWVPVMATYFLLQESCQRFKLFYIICALITSAHVLISFSRGAQCMLFIGMLPFAVEMFRKKRILFIYSAAAITSIAGVCLAVFPFAQTKYLTPMIFRIHRVKYWMEGIQHSKMSGDWLFGAGLFNYNPFGDNPHASYLSIFLYYGIVGLFFFGLIIFSIYQKAYQTRAQWQNDLGTKLIFALVTAVFLGAFFEDYLAYPVQFTQLYLWLLCGFLLKKIDQTNPTFS